MRVTTGANAWRNVEGVMGGRRISRKHEWTRDDGTNRETTGEGSYSENSPARRIVVVKRVDKRRIGEVQVEVGVKECFNKKLGRSIMLTCAGHEDRNGDEKLVKRADAQQVKKGSEEDRHCDWDCIKRN